MIKSNKNAVIVTTEEQLKAAVNKREPYIEIHGSLVKKMQWMKKVSKLKTGALTAALVAVTAGTGGGVIIPAAAAKIATTAVVDTGIAYAILACGIGLSLITAIIKGYEIEFIYDNGKLIARLNCKA